MYVTYDNGHTWVEKQQLAASDGGTDDHFGISVAVYNNTIVAGAWRNDNTRGSNAGAPLLIVCFYILFGLLKIWYVFRCGVCIHHQ